MKFLATIGDPAKPLVVGFHGWLQSPLGAKYDYFDFGKQSELEISCESLGWSCFIPSADDKHWGNRDALACADLINTARSETNSEGILLLVGFSQGGVMAHRCGALLAATYAHSRIFEPRGIWAASSPWKSSYAHARPSGARYRVALTCNESEDNKLPTFRVPWKWQSMQDYQQAARRWYEDKQHLVFAERGTAHKHRWDPSLNERVLPWLAA